MSNVIDTSKARARALHRELKDKDPEAMRALRVDRSLRDLGDDALVEAVQHRHCLAAVARWVGLRGWSHLVAVVEGRDEDVGTLLHAPGCYAHWNIWSADYAEAKAIRHEHGGFLLPYRHQFMVVDEHFVRTLGLDPDDPDWDRIGRDFVRPEDPQARLRLVSAVVLARLAA